MLPKDVYSFENMSYYVYDDVLLLTPDMDEWTVVDPEDYLGDCLTVHGFDHNNEETLYVINYLDQTVYKVSKKWNYYKR